MLRQRLQGWIEIAYADDPVLGSVRSFCSGHAKVRVVADVAEDQPRITVYDTWGWTLTGLAVCSFIGIGIGFGWYPAWKAAALHPIDALRWE